LATGVQLIVGLGNPGQEYKHTRHNAGFWFVDQLAHDFHTSFKPDKKFHGEVAKTHIHGMDVWLLKPDTYMNLSGQSVQSLATFYKITLPQILVIHDDLDLPVGTVKLKKGGGHGGHNGLRDIMQRMGKDFLRLRLGIGHPGDKDKVTGHVLKKASTDDQIEIEQTITEAICVLDLIVTGDVQKAMNKLHTNS